MSKHHVINGTDGDDEIIGTKKDDKIDGGDGSDTIGGGKAGKDILIGGPGDDYFAFNFKGDLDPHNVDTIVDFNDKEDQILLSYKIFKKIGFGPVKEEHTHVGKHAADKDDYLIYDPKKHLLSYDPDGKGGHGQVPIVYLKDYTYIPFAFTYGTRIYQFPPNPDHAGAHHDSDWF